jgi:hypothetical protein
LSFLSLQFEASFLFLFEYKTVAFFLKILNLKKKWLVQFNKKLSLGQEKDYLN